jgi:hypothetical protein
MDPHMDPPIIGAISTARKVSPFSVSRFYALKDEKNLIKMVNARYKNEVKK